jgi:predicted Zn-dependent protease
MRHKRHNRDIEAARNAGAVAVAVALAVLAGLSLESAMAATPAADPGKNVPVLKAIDPSMAKMDSLPKPKVEPSPIGDPDSLNPQSGIKGAPISGNKPRSSLPQQAAAPPAGLSAPRGYPAAGYTQMPAQPSYAPPGYPGNPYAQAPGAYPSAPAGYAMAPGGYPAAQGAYPQPTYPAPGYPGNYAPQMAPGYGYAPYAQVQPPGQFYGQPGLAPLPYANYNMQPPAYGFGGQPAYGNPPGFVSGPQQQRETGQQFPQGRARFGGAVASPQWGQQMPQQQMPPQQMPQQQMQNPYQGYPQQPGMPPPGLANNLNPAVPQQFQNTNFPSDNLIPDFGKPLPLDASSRGPAGGWSTDPPAYGGGSGGSQAADPDPDEARVSRLEKIAFGSTYPEHEVVDRVDHLEKEIFGEKSAGDVHARIMRLEAKLGGRGGFGSPIRNQGSNTGMYGSQAGGQIKPLADEGNPSPVSPLAAGASTAEADAPNPSEGSPTQAAGEAAPEVATVGGVTAKDDSRPADPDAPKIPFDRNAGDYLDQVSRFVNNSMARWTRFPVRVRLPDDAPPRWREMLVPGIDKWARYFPVKTASGNESGDIEVSFVNHLVPRVLGVTRMTVSAGHMRVFIYLLRPTYYQAPLPEKTLASAFLHELGHGLGIFGHSNKQSDLMYAFTLLPGGSGKLTQDKLGSITLRDVNTLKLIYDADPLPEDFNLSSPQEWSLVEGAS